MNLGFDLDEEGVGENPRSYAAVRDAACGNQLQLARRTHLMLTRCKMEKPFHSGVKNRFSFFKT